MGGIHGFRSFGKEGLRGDCVSQVDVIIPTYRPGKKLIKILKALCNQTIIPESIILMNTDRSEFDKNTELLNWLSEHEQKGVKPKVQTHHVTKDEFDHGLTRKQGVGHSNAEFFVCMTDDAIPMGENVLEMLLQPFKDSKVAVSYARQLPGKESSILERYTRGYNYPEQSVVKTKEHLEEYGIKTYFCSNACAAYRRSVFDELGGFIEKTIFNEDMIYAASVIKAGYAIAYEAKAEVLHAHRYGCMDQLHRNFDLGVSQADHPEVFAGISSESEGIKMVSQVIKQLCRDGKWYRVPGFCMNCGFKLLGYRLGKAYKKLPKGIVKKLSMNRNYWKV